MYRMTQRSCPYRWNWKSGFRLLKIINLKKVRFLPLKKHQLELVVWLRTTSLGHTVQTFLDWAFSFLAFSFSILKFFVLPTCLHGMIFFPTFLRILLEKYTIFFAISHLYWKFSNREEKKKDAEKSAPQRCSQFLWKDENQVLQLLHNALCNIFR